MKALSQALKQDISTIEVERKGIGLKPLVRVVSLDEKDCRCWLCRKEARVKERDERGIYSSLLPNSCIILRSQQDKMVSGESEDGCLNLGVKNYKSLPLLSFSLSPLPSQARHVIFLIFLNNQHQWLQQYSFYFFFYSLYFLLQRLTQGLHVQEKQIYPKCVDLPTSNSTLFYPY